MLLVIALSCATNADSGDSSTDSGEHVVTDYVVNATTEPDPLLAGEASTFSFEVRDQDDLPIEDLQTTHERVVHVQFVSHDLSSFQHVHNEDFVPLTADNLRTSSFAFPLTVPLAGEYLTVFDFAHHNQYLSRSMSLAASGTPMQAAAPDLTLIDEVTVDGVTGQLSFSAPPVPGYEAAWSIYVFDAAGPISLENDPIVQYLGADAHIFVAATTLDWTAHSHAWYPGMETVAPGHSMPHVNDGPDLPFHYVLPTSGTYKFWLQFTRASDPTHVYVLPFVFAVEG